MKYLVVMATATERTRPILRIVQHMQGWQLMALLVLSCVLMHEQVAVSWCPSESSCEREAVRNLEALAAIHRQHCQQKSSCLFPCFVA